jgi:hypothetical protein
MNRKTSAVGGAVGVSAGLPQSGRTSSSGSPLVRNRKRARAWLEWTRGALAPALRPLLGLLLLALSVAQAAAGADQPLELRYRFSWAGVPISELALRHVINGGVYQTELAIASIGLADQLVHFRGASRATGRYEAQDGFSVSRFRSASSSYRKSRTILVGFDPHTGDVVELELTKRGEPDRSKVPAALQKAVIDPLTALVQLRHRLARDQLDDYTAAVFDGRRRFDLKAQVVGRRMAEIAGRDQPVIELQVGLDLIAGANQDDLDDAEAGDDQMRLKLLLSDDERLIPLQLSTMDSLFTATAEIMPECLEPGGCPPVSG